MERHLRNTGLSITQLARRLGLSRNTLYNNFKRSELSEDFILNVSRLVGYSFSSEVDGLKQEKILSPTQLCTDLADLQQKHIALLERYIWFTGLINKAANENDMAGVKKAINELYR